MTEHRMRTARCAAAATKSAAIPKTPMRKATVIGGGLAGCEAALQLSARGIAVELIEARPLVRGPAHGTDFLGELVCSNSLKSEEPTTASGQLKAELDILGCRLLRLAKDCRVPAGSALAVDRTQFARAVTAAVDAAPHVTRTARVADGWDTSAVTVLATGPLTFGGMSDAMRARFGGELPLLRRRGAHCGGRQRDMSRSIHRRPVR